MEPFKAHTFYNVGKIIESVAASHGVAWVMGTGFSVKPRESPVLDEPVSPESKQQILFMLSAINVELENIGLERSLAYSIDIARQLNQSDIPKTNREVGYLLRELDKHIRWDMEKKLFLYVPSERSKYFANERLLSHNNFPSATAEIKEAGNCYAAGAFTASVLHSMRSLEKPIQSVALKLNITLPKAIEVSQWGEIHREINNEVVKLRNTPLTSTRDEEIAFYSYLNLEFGYFNDIWRRFVAHSRKAYDMPQALSALNHVIAFINQVGGSGLKELP